MALSPREGPLAACTVCYLNRVLEIETHSSFVKSIFKKSLQFQIRGSRCLIGYRYVTKLHFLEEL